MKNPRLQSWICLLGIVTIVVLLLGTKDYSATGFWSGMVCGLSLAAAPWYAELSDTHPDDLQP